MSGMENPQEIDAAIGGIGWHLVTVSMAAMLAKL